MYSTISLQKVQFVNGECTPSEANDVITKVIDDQIKFYKLQNLSRWIHDCNCDQDSIYTKIEHLKQRKQELREIINQAKAEGRKINLTGDFRLSLEK